MENEVKVILGTEKYTTQVEFKQHQIVVDEPEELGGKDLGPTPTALLLSSLGSCKAITMRMYADQKGWPIDRVEIALSSSTDKDVNPPVTAFNIAIKLVGNLDDMQRERIIKVGEKCPIQKILSNPIVIQTNIIQ